jgi:Bacterial membrane protein YfhO
MEKRSSQAEQCSAFQFQAGVAFRFAASFNLRVQPTASENPMNKLFTPLRFGILLALLVFATFPQVILGFETFVARDFGFFAYPLAHFQRECFWHGELPFWNPYNQCGVPFLAQWNTMPLYPPSLIYLTLPLEWSLSFFCLLHLWFAGLGMFFLACRWTGNNFAAAFAGVAFAFNGFTLNLLMWPSHMATFAWMPWVVLAAELAWREGGRKIFLAAIVGALQMLAGGPETIFLTWLIVAALWLQQLVKNESPRPALLWRLPLVIALVIALSAAQLLPFLDLVAHAQRESGFADLRWSMPGRGWANFLVPMAFGTTHTEGIFFQHDQYWTSSYYLGIGALWLALLALACVRERRVWLLGVIAIAGLIFALGENTPVLPALQKLIPQLSFITYPIKYVSVVIFAATLLAAFALANFQKVQKRLLPFGAILLTLIIAIMFWTRLAPMPGDESQAALLNGVSREAFLLLTGAILFGLAREAKSRLLQLAPLLLLLTAWADVFTHMPAQNPTAPPWIYQPGLAREKLALNPQPELGGSRLMVSPAAANAFVSFAANDPKNNFLAKRIGYCANCNVLDAVPKVDGFFSLTPRESDEVLSLFYRTTNADFPQLEDFMGVSQITAPHEMLKWQARTNFLPLVTAGQKPVFIDDSNMESHLTNPDFDGSKIVFLPPEAKLSVTLSNQTTAKILNSKFDTQTVDAEVESAEPSLVVIAQTYYHNWRAEIDGQPTQLLHANVAFQAVQVPKGTHKIHLAYVDRAFQIGAAVSIVALVGCLIGLIRLPRRKNN